MPALLAIVALIPLLTIPGTLVARALSGPREAADPLERHYARVVVGALLNGWLALALAGLGVFSIWLHLLLIALVCAGALLVARRRGALPTLRGRGWKWGRGIPHGGWRWDTLAICAILLVFALLVARPFEVVLGVRDAGVYASTGLAIARTGAIVQRDELVAQIAADQADPDPSLRDAAAQAETNLLGVQPRQRNIATRLRAAGFFISQGELGAGRVVPQGFHLFPAWIGLLASLAGPQGGLLATGLMGFLGVWSVAMLGRRLAGPAVGVLAALLLALNGAQVWFSRYSTAEAIAQFLTFAGLFFFAQMHSKELRAEDQQSSTTPDGSQLSALGPRDLAALLAGLALGQLALARIDFALVLAPAFAFLLYAWLTRRWRRAHTALLAGLALMLAHAAAHIAAIARAYFFDTLFADLQLRALTALAALPFLTPELREVYLVRPCSTIGLAPCPPVAGMPPASFQGWNYPRIIAELALLALALVGLHALRRWGGPLIARAEGVLRRYAAPLLALAALVIALLGAYAYLVRPQILTPATIAALPGCLAPSQLRAPQGPCLRLQGYVGAPIAPPAYADALAAWLDSLPRLLRGQPAPSPSECAAFRAGFLPPAADGYTSVELRRDGLVSEEALGPERWAQLRACDRVVLRDLYANSQANLVRVGWYLSPLGVILGLAGFALWWRRLSAASWLFLVVALIAGLFFLRLTYGTSDQHYIYILRRYVPVVYPALCLGAAYALVALARRWPAAVGRWSAAALALALVAFNLATNVKIYTHTEYAGALGQIEAIAGRFTSQDVLLLRGGAPTHGAARDLPDNLATPLTYAFGLNAFTVKSAEPGKYAAQIARYVERWRAEGREVYLLLGASGALSLPGFGLERAGVVSLDLPEFEQPTTQKPSNVQEYTIDFVVYRLVPGVAPAPPSLSPDDYGAQVRGFYRAEASGGEPIAWTDGDALLRLPVPRASDPLTLTVRLAPGPTRPARLGQPRACLSLRPETSPWVEDPQAPPFSTPVCYELTPGMAGYQLAIEPSDDPSATSLLLRIESDTWLPARDDPQQHDQRLLGVQFGGLALSYE